jgi:EAL domain-containing protein (putative c-di-GMP-specific phosphodiesterase class I)
MPAAEQYGLSPRIDRWVVRTALHWLTAHPAHLDELQLCCINLSGLSLVDEGFLEFVHDMIDSTSVPARKICFEITETAAIANLATATRFIEALAERKCRFALDDFGTGLSSFGYLKNLPVDFLKIDGMFVKGIEDDPIDLAMVQAIQQMAQAIGKSTIAEFVENAAILERLRSIGVDYAQGYHIGWPRPVDELTRHRVA